jgi:hypothetical protein
MSRKDREREREEAKKEGRNKEVSWTSVPTLFVRQCHLPVDVRTSISCYLPFGTNTHPDAVKRFIGTKP